MFIRFSLSTALLILALVFPGRSAASTPGGVVDSSRGWRTVRAQTATKDFALDAVPRVTDLRIARSGMDAQLRWSVPGAQVDSYELWRGTTPYFVAPSVDDKVTLVDMEMCDLIEGTVTCTDAAAFGDPAVNTFYVVLAVGASGERSAPSNRVGEFDFALEQGGRGNHATHPNADRYAHGAADWFSAADRHADCHSDRDAD